MLVMVAALVGLSSALILLLLTTLCGALVLRRAGHQQMARFRVAVIDTDITGIEANPGGFVTVLAGLLLFLPGFLTDLIGAALLIRAVPGLAAGPSSRGCGPAKLTAQWSILRLKNGERCRIASYRADGATRTEIPRVLVQFRAAC